MTEQEWLECTDPKKMLDFLRGKSSDRKLRLFAVACCRRIWHLLIAEVEVWHTEDAADWKRCQDAVLLAERFADGEATTEELIAVTAYPRRSLCDAEAAMFTAEVQLYPILVSEKAAEAVGQEAAGRVYSSFFPNGYSPTPENMSLMAQMEEESEQEYARTVAVEKKAQCDLLRDLFGNPLRTAAINPSWLAWNNGIVVKLAQAIYDERAFDRMPILADALEEAGCTDADILPHCRQPGNHIRGCWVVDAVLGKT